MPDGAVATSNVPERLRDTFDVGQSVTVSSDGEQLLECHPTAPVVAVRYGAPRSTRRGIRGVPPLRPV
jgi:hypothetical protein